MFRFATIFSLMLPVAFPATAQSEAEPMADDKLPFENVYAGNPHHDPNGGFRNIHPTFEHRGFGDFLQWALFTDRRTAPDEGELALAPEELRWSPDADPLGDSDWEVAWVGHSTLLVRLGDRYILTDPIWSERCSPVSFAGPKRVVDPGIEFDQLPPIEAVLISHNHYDHLDVDTIERLQADHQPMFFVPLGNGAWLDDLGISNYKELDWWDQVDFNGYTYHAVPVQHFSGRGMFDRNETLWAGWVVETPAGNFFHGGDFGYSPDFLAIRARLGEPRLAAIPIGAYDPQSFMGPVHVNPSDAVRVHREVGSHQSIAIHWGTFRLANDPLTEGPKLLKQALKAQGVPESEFWVFQHGEARPVPALSRHEHAEPTGPTVQQAHPESTDKVEFIDAP